MKADLCKAFCGDLIVREVPDGLAVSTTFRRDDGDAVGFYVVPTGAGLFRIEDDGTTVPFLVESGVDFTTETRRRALATLLQEYDAIYDEDAATIRTESVTMDDLPRAAMSFVALMLRMGDFQLLSQDKVASTFREDAARRVREALDGRAMIRENEPVSRDLSEIVPDMVIEAQGRPPVALFFGVSPSRIYEAIMLHMTASYEAHCDVSVVALLESESVVSQELRRRAANRLAAVPVYRHDEAAAVTRIAQEAVGPRLH